MSSADDAHDVQISYVLASGDTSDLQLGNVCLSSCHLRQPHQPGLYTEASAASAVSCC